MLINANNIKVNYELEGAENAPLVMFSHSLAANLRMWDDQARSLHNNFRVLRYDTRGHGQTEVGKVPYSLELLTTDCISLLDALQIETVHFVGLSLGGMIGQSAAMQYPGRFRSLSLCDTTSYMPPDILGSWEDRIEIAKTNGMSALVETTITRWFSEQFQSDHKAVIDAVRSMIETTPVDGYCGCAQSIMDLDITAGLSTISVPTLLLVGENDPGTPVSAHRIMHENIKHSELNILPNALHLSNIEESKLFNRILFDFLERNL